MSEELYTCTNVVHVATVVSCVSVCVQTRCYGYITCTTSLFWGAILPPEFTAVKPSPIRNMSSGHFATTPSGRGRGRSRSRSRSRSPSRSRSRSLSVAAGGASKGQGKRVREELVDGSPPPGMGLQTRAQGRSDVSTCEYREGGDMWQGKCDHWAHLARKMLWHLCACKLQAESPACPPRTKRLGGVGE
jgi:hypothetical protein